MFKFDKSTHLADDNSVKEHRRNASDVSNDDLLVNTLTSDRLKSERKLVCTPDPSLIRKIYLPLLRFSEEISDMMKTKPGHPNTFNEFVATHVKEVFLAKGHNRNLQNTIESLSKNHDAWRAIITPEEMKAFGLNRPLLQSTVVVESSELTIIHIIEVISSHFIYFFLVEITETKNLIRDLPNYSEDLLKMVCSLLKTYRETCQAAYRGIVQPETEDKRIYSVAWLKDEDICRFLKLVENSYFIVFRNEIQTIQLQNSSKLDRFEIGSIEGSRSKITKISESLHEFGRRESNASATTKCT